LQKVVTAQPIDCIVSVTTVDCVVSITAVQNIVTAIALDFIGFGRADDRVWTFGSVEGWHFRNSPA
jgi:hypothetical protein